MTQEILSGPVFVCVDRPLLSLDRPFTYELPGELGAGAGSLVRVPFHGRHVKGWVLGPTDDVPARMLKVSRLESPVEFFDRRMLDLLRWMSERYVAPLATMIGRSFPPRVVSEETSHVAGHVAGEAPAGLVPSSGPLSSYANGEALLEAAAVGRGEFILRPAPADEAACAVESATVTIAAGRTAIVIVPEQDPLPATAAALHDAFAERTAMFLGGDKRERYRMWLRIKAGQFDCVVGTRAAVFAPVPRLGLVYISRESHALHREERSPSYHVREVALARARIEGSACVMQAFCPTTEAAATDALEVSPRRRNWPPVEVVKPGPEGRAPRLVSALKATGGAFLFEPMRGYGVARVCKNCSEPASCPECGGVLRLGKGDLRCAVCGASGRCRACGGTDFGIRRGGAERVEEWARGISALPVHREAPDERPRPPAPGEVTIGGPESVKEFGAISLDLVGVLDADFVARRAGLTALEHALAVWTEAAAWAWPRGRVIVQTERASSPAVQALVAGNPSRFHRFESERRREAGFPVGFPVFRILGRGDMASLLAESDPHSLLSTTSGSGEAICLVAISPERVPAFGEKLRELARRGIVTRVEAEPHL